MLETTRSTARRLARVATSPAFVRHPLRQLSQRGWLPASVWRRLPVRGRFRVEMGEGAGFSYSTDANDATGRALYWRGLRSWEFETVSVFMEIVRQARVVVDVGANTGVFCLLAHAVNDRLRTVAFEPVPRIFERLRANLRLNGWDKHCAVHCAAVGDASGLAVLHVPFSDVPTSASLHQAGFRGTPGDLVEVRKVTLDAVLGKEIAVDIIKVDVEGFEPDVLRGAAKLLERCRPTLICECNVDGRYKEVENIVLQYGYQLFHLAGGGPRAMQTIEPDHGQRFRNYLMVHPGRLRWLEPSLLQPSSR